MAQRQALRILSTKFSLHKENFILGPYVQSTTESSIMQNIAGSPVEGTDFFGRETAIRSLWDLLSNHDILLLGPRRIGKTSLARRLMVEARQSGWHAIEVNVASCIDERAFVNKLTEEVKNAARFVDRCAS